jgi:hypothetical protein
MKDVKNCLKNVYVCEVSLLLSLLDYNSQRVFAVTDLHWVPKISPRIQTHRVHFSKKVLMLSSQLVFWVK